MRSSTYRFSEDMGADTVRAPYGRVSDGIGDDTVGQHRCGYGRLLLGRHRCLGAQLHPHTHKPEQPAVRSNFTKVQKFALLVLKSLKTGPKLRAPYGTKNRSPPPPREVRELSGRLSPKSEGAVRDKGRNSDGCIERPASRCATHWWQECLGTCQQDTPPRLSLGQLRAEGISTCH